LSVPAPRAPAARAAGPDIESEPCMPLKILFIGDVVGSPGRKIVCQALPRLIPRWGIGLVVCNAENAAGGSGLTIRCFEELIEAGVDVMTMGDHVYRKDEIFQVFERSDRVVRPANFPKIGRAHV